MADPIRVLIVDDELIVRESLAGWLGKAGYAVDAAPGGRIAVEMIGAKQYDLIFLDVRMSDLDGMEVLKRVKLHYPETLVVMMTAYGTVQNAVDAMKAGADDYLIKPFEPEYLPLLVEKLLKQKRLLDENIALRDQADVRAHFHGLIGASECMRRLFAFIDQVAEVDSPVLLQGETGTGKELVAKAIHAKSKRRFGPFVPINCGAFAETLLESELFGHEVGSFTGATRAQKGRLEMAKGGTLFLDEVGEIPPKMQVDLLRVLQEKRFQRVGGSRDVFVDFRLICATHRDLTREVSKGNFRQDFYFRLKVIEIEVPALRDRRQDIPLLARHFLDRFRRETNKRVTGITEDAMMLLQSYDWPGNVRELENTLERAVVLSNGAVLNKADFGFLFRTPQQDVPLSLEEMEKVHIERVLKLCRWNISKAAKVLEVNRATLHNKIRKFGLRSPE
ncbi:sigma-54-dependent transcriptional regulator [Syntrophobacter fumaroxidans]|uniref:Two component, sigma54 specific, transcriptional regulator, Fis family n=1 Tax=Syntrophobacter fumaroxidans (strain DSM 10017 / MPOB) TaxID=335543 RepID=A0LGH2_SYNFM|nr:sigma-54 dependent transcriptional regulator [Syntrophobacter fumaroxidans]ABK16524.1 two component, sigma54 specific, transcriptional regulator, Fis family [Syntrophobacter fumaroxidans MPOB]